MKTKPIKFIAILLLCGLFTQATAQETITETETETETIPVQTKKRAKFGIRNLGFHIEYYQPSLEYWNDTYFENEGWEGRFTGGFNYGVFLNFQLTRSLRIRTGFSNWSQTVKSGNILKGVQNQNRSIKLSLTSPQLDILMQTTIGYTKLKPYFGVGGRMLLISEKFTRQIDDLAEYNEVGNAQTYTGHAILGMERHFFDLFSVAIEGGYVFGKYQKYFKNANNVNEIQDISLSGLQVKLKFLYDF